MSEKDQWLIDTLLGIKEDMGDLKSKMTDVSDLKSDVSDIKTDVASLKTALPKYQSDLTTLTGRVDSITSKLETITTKELPEIREKLAVRNWLDSNRNKVVAAVGAALLTGIGSVVGSLALEKIKDISPSVVTDAQAASPKAPPVASPVASPAESPVAAPAPPLHALPGAIAIPAIVPQEPDR